jgi:hypothetical protein
MQQFVIPQFIDVEDKIIGPITTRQFMIMLVGGIGIAIVYKTTDFTRFIIGTIIILAMVIIFAFLKVNGQFFHLFLVNILEKFKKPSLRVWDKTLTGRPLVEKIEQEKEELVIARKKPLIKSRLTELSLIVDTGGVYEGEESNY